MEKLIDDLIARARAGQTVLTHRLDDGQGLLAYPLADGALVAIGQSGQAARHLDAEQLLRERSRQLPRMGSWLPALLQDGSWYLVRRIGMSGAIAAPSDDEIAAVRKLLR